MAVDQALVERALQGRVDGACPGVRRVGAEGARPLEYSLLKGRSFARKPFARRFERLGASAEEGQNGRQRHDPKSRARRPWRIRAFTGVRCARRARLSRTEVSRAQGQRRAPAGEHRRSDRDMDGAGARAGFAAGARAASRAGRQKRRGPRSRDRLDLSRPEQWRDRAGRRSRRIRSSEASSFGDRAAGSCRKCRCGPSHSTIRARLTRRWSNKPITGGWWRWRRRSPAGLRGSLGFSGGMTIRSDGGVFEFELLKRFPASDASYESAAFVRLHEAALHKYLDRSLAGSHELMIERSFASCLPSSTPPQVLPALNNPAFRLHPAEGRAQGTMGGFGVGQLAACLRLRRRGRDRP